jgi:hypothetical protein
MAARSFLDALLAFFGFGDREAAPAAESAAPPPALPAPAVADDTIADDRLPPSALGRVKKIRASLAALEQQAEARHLFDESLEIRRLKSNHLPRLLRSYIDIPPEHRPEVFRETGRSASYLLNERLDKILERLQEMSRQLARGNLNAFAENIRFVDVQYGESGSPFD